MATATPLSRPPSWPSPSHISSATCGENGASITIKASSASRTAKTSEAEADAGRSEEHTSELQSRLHLVCRLLLEKKKKNRAIIHLEDPSLVIPHTTPVS